MTPIVLLHDVDEFLSELTPEAECIERNILRLTRSYRQLPTISICAESIIATALAHGQILRLERRVGDYVNGNHTHAEQVQARTDGLYTAIEAQARALGLQLRPGVLLSREPQP